MSHPIVGVCGFGRRNPRAGYIRKIRNLGWLQCYSTYMLPEKIQDRIHHRRMECVRGMEFVAQDALIGEILLQFLDRRAWSGNDTLLWSIHGGNGKWLGNRELFGGERDGEHCA